MLQLQHGRYAVRACRGQVADYMGRWGAVLKGNATQQTTVAIVLRLLAGFDTRQIRQRLPALGVSFRLIMLMALGSHVV